MINPEKEAQKIEDASLVLTQAISDLLDEFNPTCEVLLDALTRVAPVSIIMVAGRDTERALTLLEMFTQEIRLRILATLEKT
jgi:hypothetical protein